MHGTVVNAAHTARKIRKAEHDRLAKLVDGSSADGFRLVAVASRVLEPRELVCEIPTGDCRFIPSRC